MRHRLKGSNLGRTTSHKTATMRSLATALIKHKKIKTTIAKAKEMRLFVEPLITKAKVDSVHARRIVSRDIKDKEVVKELFNEVIPKIGSRPGGYTRIIKLGNRLGDSAEMAYLELVDFSDVIPKKTSKESSKSTSEKSAKKVKDKSDTKNETKSKKISSKSKKAESNKNSSADDLTKIEGIGPKIAEVLNEKDIKTYSDLSKCDSNKLREILAEAGSNFKSHDPETWPKQAKLAADGNWDELKKLQDDLQGGREKS